jgi:cell division protein FtsB
MRPRWVLLACALVATSVAGYALLGPSGLPRLSAQDTEREALARDVAQLEDHNAALREQARTLADDEASRPFVEKAVREELGYVRPDERVVLLDEDAGESP